MKKRITIFSLLLFVLAVQAQNKTRLHLSFDAGSNNMGHLLRENWQVRQDAGSYFMGNSYVTGSIITDTYHNYFSVKPQLQIGNRLNLLSGLRLSILGSTISPGSGNDYHFFLKKESANAGQTSFYRVRGIDEQNYYLSIPLELKVKIWEQDWMRGFGFYLHAGTHLGFLIHSSQNIDFLTPEMQSHTAEFFDILPKGKLLSQVYGGLSFRYTTLHNYILSVDFPLFSSMLNKDNSSLMLFDSGGSGAQFSVAVPLCRSKSVHNNPNL